MTYYANKILHGQAVHIDNNPNVLGRKLCIAARNYVALAASCFRILLYVHNLLSPRGLCRGCEHHK